MTRPTAQVASVDGTAVLIEQGEVGGEGAGFEARRSCVHRHGSMSDGDVPDAGSAAAPFGEGRSSRCSESSRARRVAPSRPSATASIDRAVRAHRADACIRAGSPRRSRARSVNAPQDVRGIDVAESEGAHAGGVDDPAVAAVAVA